MKYMKYIKVRVVALSLAAIMAFLGFLQCLRFFIDARWFLFGMQSAYPNELIASALVSLALSVVAISLDKK